MVANNLEEQKLAEQGYKYIAGIDESGMGCFAGDVYVGVVILPLDIDYKTLLPGLDDSKKKTADQRNELYKLVTKHALAYHVESASVQEIDTLNIYWARFAAVTRALEKISITPDYLLIDGNKEVPKTTIPQHAIVKGDGKSISIAAASILAKVARDEHIDELATKVHSDYDWINNKSYYCQKHVDAIKKHGKTKYHRQKYVSKYLPDTQETW